MCFEGHEGKATHDGRHIRCTRAVMGRPVSASHGRISALVPASPPSPRSDTGPPGVPLDTLLAAAQQAGYVVALKQAVSAHGGPNPTRVDLRRGPLLVKLLVYSWYITLEGKGRKKDDFRIQTTRAHDGPLRSERGRISVGVGWREPDKLFVAFDAWAKRYTGGSSSVHTRRAFIDDVAKQGSAVGGEYLHDPRCGFDEAHVGDFIKWAHSLAAARRVGLVPVRTTWIDAKHKIITGKIHATQATGRLREKDAIILFDKKRQIVDPGLWRVTSLSPVEEKTAGGRSRWLVDFSCQLVGSVSDLPQKIIDDLL